MAQASDNNLEIPERWWMATAIPMANIRGKNVDYWTLELFSEETTEEEVRKDVMDYWDISDADSCKSIVRELLDGEHVGHIWQNRFRKRSCVTEHQWQEIIDKSPSTLDAGELLFTDSVYQQAGVAGFLAWDLSRGAYLIRQGYFLGWITKAELIFILSQIAFHTQDNFSCWREFTNSFIFGRNVSSYLSEEDLTANIEQLNSSGFALYYNNYFNYFEDDYRNEVYNIPWNTSLPYIDIPESLRAPETTEGN